MSFPWHLLQAKIFFFFIFQIRITKKPPEKLKYQHQQLLTILISFDNESDNEKRH